MRLIFKYDELPEQIKRDVDKYIGVKFKLKPNHECFLDYAKAFVYGPQGQLLDIDTSREKLLSDMLGDCIDRLQKTKEIGHYLDIAEISKKIIIYKTLAKRCAEGLI